MFANRDLYEDRFFLYPEAKAITEHLDRLVAWPDVDRRPSALIVADSNGGKMALLKHFASKHPRDLNETGDAARIPVLWTEAPPRANLTSYFVSILQGLGASFNERSSGIVLEQQALGLIRECGVKVIVIDELHNLIKFSPVAYGQFLNMIRHLSTALRTSVVAAGLPQVEQALFHDAQLANRFRTFRLEPWGVDLRTARMVMSYERALGFAGESELGRHEVLTFLATRTEGLLGEIITLLRAGAEVARERKEDVISYAALQAADYVPPVDRFGRAA